MRKFIDIINENTVFKAPDKVDFKGIKIFLAGSIDQGQAIDWQFQSTEALEDYDIAILNPRRDDWDSSWEQDISNPEFKEQVVWELDCQDMADIIMMYFDPKGQAPITLAELGLYAASGKLIVCCPEGYWRRGNVQIICDRYNIPMVDTLDDLIDKTKDKINELLGK